MREAGDQLAWEAIAAAAMAGEVRVVMVAGATGETRPAAFIGQVSSGLTYDQIVELMEWSDKVVVW